MEGLVWASLLAFDHPQVHRHAKYAVRFGVQSRENVDVWLLPILEAYIHQAWSGNNSSAGMGHNVYIKTHKNHDKENLEK